MLNHLKITNPKLAAFVGFLFAVPFLVMNAIIGSQIEPFYSLLRPGGVVQPGIGQYVSLFTPLLLLPLIGAFVAIRPMLQNGADGKRKLFLLNIIVATILLIGSITLSIGLGTEIYRCDVLHIPNCD